MELQLKDIAKAHQERKAKLDVLEEDYEAASRQLKKEIAMLEGAAHKILLERGEKSVRTDFGTVFRQKWTKARVVDMAALWEWAVEHNRKDVFNKAANKTVVQEEIDRAKEELEKELEEAGLEEGEKEKLRAERAGCPIPGVEMEEGYKCHIRKSPQ